MKKVLVTGANGYIGQRLVMSLLAQGYKVVCVVRDISRFDTKRLLNFDPSSYIPDDYIAQENNLREENIEVIQGDFLNLDSLKNIPRDISIAYYLIHSMSNSQEKDFTEMEALSVKNFIESTKDTDLEQVIYLGGIVNDENLSPHLNSRLNVEATLRSGKFNLTVLRAAIIIGSGSASFEIIRDLTEKLPVMLAPKWLSVKCEPIAIKNVIQYLTGVILKPEAYNKVFDIGGGEILSYKEMLLGYAKVRKLKRWIITVPVMTPRLSSYWLYLVTSTNYSLAKALVSSLRNEVVCKHKGIEKIVPLELFNYEDSILRTLYKVSQDEIPSSWKDAWNLKSTNINFHLANKQAVPEFGILFDLRKMEFTRNAEEVKANVWQIGGNRGWYYMNWVWQIRGYLDKFVGGVGLRRGRREDLDLKVGDSLDFWRVLYANKEEGHLILFAEMKIPGEAWLEFKVTAKVEAGENVEIGVCEQSHEYGGILEQKATFRPHGLFGIIYWYSLVPVHELIFKGMARNIIGYSKTAL
ncbi:MAG: SDR family oxidoreductase [Vampirovibrionia bacterium]